MITWADVTSPWASNIFARSPSVTEKLRLPTYNFLPIRGLPREGGHPEQTGPAGDRANTNTPGAAAGRDPGAAAVVSDWLGHGGRFLHHLQEEQALSVGGQIGQLGVGGGPLVVIEAGDLFHGAVKDAPAGEADRRRLLGPRLAHARRSRGLLRLGRLLLGLGFTVLVVAVVTGLDFGLVAGGL